MADTTKYDFGHPPPFGEASFGQAFDIPPEPTQDPPMLNYRGATLCQPFDMRKRMQISREKPMLGLWAGAFMYPGTLRMYAQAGYDFVLLDWEHTPMNIGDIGEHIKAINYGSEGRTACIVRVPTHSHHYIAWCLDAGASSVILPHTETVEQAEQAVAAARFPVHGGARSGPPNALAFGYSDGGGIVDVWNRGAVIMQIESAKGADNADAIAAVPGVDAIMFGPGDLALDLGLNFFNCWTNQRYLECVNKISAAAKKHGLASLGPGLNNKSVGNMLALGFTMITCGDDGIVLSRTLRQDLVASHEVMNEWKKSTANK